MQAQDAALVQESFAAVRALGDAAPELFYGRLFEIASEARPMFQGDMAGQGRKLMGALAVVANGLPGLLPAAEALARAAWSRAYDALSGAMIAAAYPAGARAA